MELTALLEATFSFDEQCDGVGWALGDSVETLLLKYFISHSIIPDLVVLFSCIVSLCSTFPTIMNQVFKGGVSLFAPTRW